VTSTQLADRPRPTPGRRPFRGDEGELYREHHEKLYRITRYKIRDCPDELIEDACAIAWMQLCRTQPTRENIMAWLITVARHAALHLLKGETATEELEDAGWVVGGSVDDDADLAREVRALLEGLSELKPAQRTTLALKAAGFKYTEIQELCGGKTYTWVNRHITEGRAALRAALDASATTHTQHEEEREARRDG
jgi:DNA-directed RNA polymerase specialized sigma24 family protein